MGAGSSKEAAPPKILPKAQDVRPSESPRNKVKEEDYNAPLKREALPLALQHLVDEEEKVWDQIYEGYAPESTESNIRYVAYASRIRTILLSAQRYVAYTSDIGESFRPIAHPYLVRGAYGISWAYLVGDVGHEGYKAYLRQQRLLYPGEPGETPISATDASNGARTKQVAGAVQVPAIEDYRAVVLQRAVFQSIASMGLPAFTIHSIVRYSGRALKDVKNRRIRMFGPIGLGLAAVPFLPFVFDKPVEDAVEWTFHKAFETIGGTQAVKHSPATGREELLKGQSAGGKIKEKEL